jgi:hypothetical protein
LTRNRVNSVDGRKNLNFAMALVHTSTTWYYR